MLKRLGDLEGNFFFMHGGLRRKTIKEKFDDNVSWAMKVEFCGSVDAAGGFFNVRGQLLSKNDLMCAKSRIKKVKFARL